MDAQTEFTKVSQIVEYYLKTEERCRNDDKWLTYRVMDFLVRKETQNKGIFIPFELFEKLPSFEAIRRTRAKIQNEKELYLANPEVRAKRLKRSGEVKDWALNQ